MGTRVTCTCGACRQCKHREVVRRRRLAYSRFSEPCGLEGHPIAAAEFPSSWVLVEDALCRWYGPPRQTVLQNIATVKTMKMLASRPEECMRRARAGRKFFSAYNKQVRERFSVKATI